MLPRWEDNKPMSLALLVLTAFLVMFIWVKTDQAIKQSGEIGKPVPYEHSIYIEGTGKASARPDLATVTFSVDTRGADQSEAQRKNTEVMNTLMSQMRAIGIEEKDMQTTYYNVWQDSVWNPDTQTYDLSDWVASSSVEVKVRNIDLVSQVLVTAGENGATNISGPNFTLDDNTAAKDAARDEAIADAMKKARLLAEKLNLKIESVIGYSEYSPDYYPPVPYYGYAADEMAAASLPEISEGETEVTLNVSITFKLAD